MTRGRKPTPTSLKKLRGNPGKRSLPKNEPAPAIDRGLVDPPAWLDRDARAAAEWRRLAPGMIKLGTLTEVDKAALESYCKSYSRWLKAESVLDKKGLTFKAGQGGYEQQRPEVAIALKYAQRLHALAAEFGFTPASRTRVKAAGDAPEADPYDEYRRRRPGHSVAAADAGEVASA